MTVSALRTSRAPKLGGLIAVIVVVIVIAQRSQRTTTPPAAPSPTTSIPPSPAPAERTATHVPTREPGASPRTAALRVGSWNIEWLGKPEERSGRDRGIAQSPGDIADYIVFARVAVLALQEIVPDRDGRRPRSTALEHALDKVRDRTGDRWDYALNPGRSEGDQLTGVAWNTASITPLDSAGGEWDSSDEPWRLPIRDARSASGAGLWNRPPYAMRFRAGDGLTDLVLIPLHMKADFQGTFADHRAREAGALASALDATKRTLKDHDLVLLGDTNITEHREAARKTFVDAGFEDLNAEELQTHWRGGTTDRVFVPVHQPEFTDASFEVMSDDFLKSRGWRPSDFKRALSDHFMVVATIRVQSDDD